MEHIKTFFDSSTIHGLSRISSTTRWSRFFWVLVVIGGFTGAGYLIYVSNYNWEQSPITTTIETLPISQITFPNITVCPPQNLFLDLNYDIVLANKIKLEDEMRFALFKHTFDLIQRGVYENIRKNVQKVEDPNRYDNWYHGFTKLSFPDRYYNWYHDFTNLSNSSSSHYLTYPVRTFATSGNISTQYFGEKWNKDNVDGRALLKISLYVPRSLKTHDNTTLVLNIDKIGLNKIYLTDDLTISCTLCNNMRKIYSHYKRNRTKPGSDGAYTIKLDRVVPNKTMRDLNQDFMPGFRLTWYYNDHVVPETAYSNRYPTKEFVR